MMHFSTIRKLVVNACRAGALLALPLTAAATNPVLFIKGAGPTNSDVTAFIDNVQVIQASNSAAVSGALSLGGFETPVTSTYTYNPSATAWTYSVQSGVARNGSGFSAPSAPEGSQVAFVQSYQGSAGSLSQQLTLGAGMYKVSFSVAQRACCGGNNDQKLEVYVDGVLVGTVQPSTTTGFTTFTSAAFAVDPPAITSFAPAAGGLGQSVTLTGTNLSSVTSLLVNGVNATSNIISNTATAVTFRVPLSTPATGTTTVTTAGGTATSTAFTVMAAPGNALAFDGTDDYVALPTNTAVPVANTAYTIEAWIKPSAMGVRGIIGWGNYSATNQVNALRLTPTGIVNYWWNNDLTVVTGDLTGRWHHVAATFDGTTRTIYLDGVAVGSDVPTGHAVPNANNLRIGSTNGGEYFSGGIDEVRVWTTARSATQVQADMRAVATVPTTGLVAYFNLDQGTPGGTNTGLTTAYDLANTYAGTLTNFALTGSTSNWVESYALVVPTATTATAITATGLTANWTAPTTGTVTNYVLDVATAADFSTVISGSPFTVAAGTLSRALTGLQPSTTYYYRVRADKTSVTGQGDYSNTITAATPSNVATLSNLVLGAGAISPAFGSATTSYSLTVASGVASTTVTPTLTQANATATVNGTVVASGAATTVALASGSNTISVVVKAQDGTTQLTYTVTVYRCSLQATAQNVTAYLNTSGTVTIAAAQLNNGSTSGCTPITYTMQRLVSAQVSEGSNLTLTAPAGMVFTSVTFASYGTPISNGNGSYSINTNCHAPSSQSAVEAVLLGNNSGTISASNAVFGDPCVNTLKNLVVQATYAAPATQLSYSCADLGNSLVLLTATDAAGNKSTATATVTIIDNLAPGAGSGPLPAAPATALANVPEAAGYGILYQLDAPNGTVFFNTNGVPYSVNNATAAVAPPSRVAYYMELSDGTTSKWVWASVDNFASTLAQLGIPNLVNNNVTWHQSVTNLNVFASANAGVTTGTGLGSGRVEMWPWNYTATNSDNVPNASSSTYDFGDQPSYNNNYGSFQVHNLTAQQTLLAYNCWGSNNEGNADIGIGNQPSSSGTNPDWTFAHNAGTYTLKRITILVPNVAPFVQPAAVTLGASGSVTVLPSQVYKGNLTDNCGSSMTVTPNTFNCANLGANQVTLTLTDASGNKTTGTTTVTVSVPAVTSTTWNGSTNADWNDCRNWSYGQVPTSAISAVIPLGTPNTPLISSGTALVNDLTINANGNLAMLSGTTLQVSGNWTSSSTNSSFGGTVTFAGTGTQAIANTGTSLGTVVVNKASGTAQLSQHMAISSSLIMSQGVLATGSYQVQLVGTATITESEANYVIGNVTATRTLSPGSSNVFGGLGLSLTPASGSTAPGNTQVVRTTGTALTGVGTSQSVQRYFDIRPTINSGLNVTMVFNYFNHELNSIPKANLVLFKSTTTTSGPWTPMGGTSNTSANQVTKAGLTDFSIWTLGNSANPLPVELLDFTAQAQGAAVALAWHTATETNSDRFEVERSLDGTSFAKLGAVAAHGTTGLAQAYAYRDAQLPTGAATLYYRLRQVDLDGAAHYSPVRMVAVGAASLTVFPNPTHTTATLTGAAPGTSVLVLDVLGQVVLATTTDASGTASLALPAGLRAGVYVVRAGAQTARLTVE